MQYEFKYSFQMKSEISQVLDSLKNYIKFIFKDARSVDGFKLHIPVILISNSLRLKREFAELKLG